MLENKGVQNFVIFFTAIAKPGVNLEIWENIRGNDLKKLFDDSRFPDNPDDTQTLPSFSTPLNRGDNYGARVTAYYQVRP